MTNKSSLYRLAEESRAEIDTWPDWKLEEVYPEGLKARNRRRMEGEHLPKPTELERAKSEIAQLRMQNTLLRRVLLNAYWENETSAALDRILIGGLRLPRI